MRSKSENRGTALPRCHRLTSPRPPAGDARRRRHYRHWYARCTARSCARGGLSQAGSLAAEQRRAVPPTRWRPRWPTGAQDVEACGQDRPQGAPVCAHSGSSRQPVSASPAGQEDVCSADTRGARGADGTDTPSPLAASRGEVHRGVGAPGATHGHNSRTTRGPGAGAPPWAAPAPR